MLKMPCLSTLHLLNGRMDLNQTCTDISMGDTKELIRFWRPWPYSVQSHWRLNNVEKCLNIT